VASADTKTNNTKAKTGESEGRAEEGDVEYMMRGHMVKDRVKKRGNGGESSESRGQGQGKIREERHGIMRERATSELVVATSEEGKDAVKVEGELAGGAVGGACFAEGSGSG
jgi:hypothetical protein